uniref:Putative N-acetylmuramoyl-L-alanine amidase n=1 Tax=viral metagenome TaxID=1070528 RepID=A0A6M3LFS6_9ZZZZ
MKFLRIVGDPGHGDDKPGAVYGGTAEKDINLAVCLRFANVARALGHDVFLTRDRDTGLSITDRLKAIDEYKADVFLSVHCNAIENAPTVNGIETYYRDDMDFPFANLIHKTMAAHSGRRNIGLFQDVVRLGKRLAVLSDDKVPSALVELGFLSNPSDRAYLIENISTIGELLAHGVDWYAHEKAGKIKDWKALLG